MGKWIIVAFVAVPLVELTLLIKIGAVLGLWPTIFIVLATGIVGGYLARREGFAVVGQIRRKIQQAEIPTNELLDGALVLISGALLLTPGLLTDFVGFLGLIPVTRSLIKQLVADKFEVYVETRNNRSDQEEFVDVDEVDSDTTSDDRFA